jgi:hypothetical protein
MYLMYGRFLLRDDDDCISAAETCHENIKGSYRV